MSTLASDLARALDPAALARSVGMTPDPWQADVLRDDASDWLLNTCRQSGKSTTAAVKGLHLALYEPGCLTLLVSPSQRQSAELFRKVVAFYRRLGRPVVAESENALSLTLENGSRVVSLPGVPSTVRGYSDVRLIVVDEAAQVPDEMLAALRPMQAVSGGQLVCLSTPYGKRGWWYEAWESGSPRWRKVRVTADQCQRIDRRFLEEERQSQASWYFRQEYLCEFSETREQLFSEEVIAHMFAGGSAASPFVFGRNDLG